MYLLGEPCLIIDECRLEKQEPLYRWFNNFKELFFEYLCYTWHIMFMGNHDHEYIIINQIMFQFRYQLV